MDAHLFNPEVLDRLEGLNERYRLLTNRIEELLDEAAHYDLEPDAEKLRQLETVRRRVKDEAVTVVRELLKEIESTGSGESSVVLSLHTTRRCR